MLSGSGMRRLKGVPRSAVREYCTHDAYKRFLCNPGRPQVVDFTKIVSYANAEMVTQYQSKQALAAFDSKRYLINRFDSRPFGHYKNM